MKKYTGNLEITKEALLQIYAIHHNDYTLKNSAFRIRIKGKECAGFTYEMGFSEILEDDLSLEIKTKDKPLYIILDPFSGYYIKNAKLDFIHNLENEDSGFFLQNFDESSYEGKFFKDDSMVPPESF